MQKKNVFNIDSCSEDMYIKHRKVKGHCHYTGKYRGAAHNICNLRYKTPKEVPIVFHNGSTLSFYY